MTLRELYAGMAMQGLLASGVMTRPPGQGDGFDEAELARVACKVADAIMHEIVQVGEE